MNKYYCSFDQPYVVVANAGDIFVYSVNEWSMSNECDGLTRIRCESNGYVKRFRRDNIYLPITDKEIAELFCSDNEELIEVKNNGQDYYPT